jgi:hypothetical protein
MTSKAREYLINVFDVEIRNLEQVLGLDCHNWLLNSAKPPLVRQKPVLKFVPKQKPHIAAQAAYPEIQNGSKVTKRPPKYMVLQN